MVVEVSPEETQAAEEQEKVRREAMMARLDAMGQALARTRSEAINARQTSGVEDIWLEDEEFYEGIDDANRSETRTNFRTKPPGQAAAKTEKTTLSTVFPNITGPFVDAASARIADMLLPTDDRSWSLKPTPIPEMEGLSNGKPSPQMLREANQLYPNQPDLAQTKLAQAVDQATQIMEEASRKAGKAQKRIEDWHVECQWHANVRQVIEDTARAGAGVLKGPVPMQKSTVVYKDRRLTRVSEIKPGSKWIDYWNFYPDPACGDNIHNGAYTWERDYLTKKQLRELRGQKHKDGTSVYIDEQIDVVIQEGPTRAEATYRETPEPFVDPESKDRFEIWYYHGTLEREDLEAAGCDCADMADPHVPAMISMVNNRVIQASLNPLDTGDFPYDVMVWRRRTGHWTGSGVARHIRTPQRMVTAASRHLMDNAGLGSGYMLVFGHGVVSADGKPLGIGPRRIFILSEDAEGVVDASKAIGQIKIDILVEELTAIINLGLRFAEDVTGLPMLLQGQMSKAPDTVGVIQILNNNASATLRRLARLFDDRITEPHVRRYYHWLLQYGEDDEKGDYCVDARGSSALVERDIQNQQIPQVLQTSLNPLFGMDPKKAAEEWLKSLHFDPKRFEFDDDEWKKIVANMAKGPADPRVAIAQLMEQSAERQREFTAALTMLEQKFEASESDKDRQLELMLKAVDAELDRMDQAGEGTMGRDKIKAMLADTVMKLRTQRELSFANMRTRQVMKPPTEPTGRAKKGRAFQA